MGTFSLSAYLVVSPMQLDCCPLCLKKGRHSSLTFFRMSLKESALLCSNMQCPFPLGTDYDDVFIEHEVSESEGDISEGSGSDEDTILKTFPLLSSRVSDFKYSKQKDSGNEAVESRLPSMNLCLPDIDSSTHSGSCISQDKTFSSNPPTDELHQMLKATDGLEFEDIESIYLSTNNSMLSEEGFEEFDTILSEMEFHESSKLKENKSPSSKIPPSEKCDISDNHIPYSMPDYVNSAHSSSSQLSYKQDVKRTIPQISPIEKIQVWMKNVPDPKSDSATVCMELIPKLKSAGNNSGTILDTKHSSDLSPNNNLCPSTSNDQECLFDHNSSANCQESLDTLYAMHREDDSIIKLHETDIQQSRGDNISDLCSTSDNGQELPGDKISEKYRRISRVNTRERQSGDENISEILTLVENDKPENNLYTSVHHMSNFTLDALNSTSSHRTHQSSEKYLETYKRSSPSTSTDNENMSYVHMVHEDDKRGNTPSTYKCDLLKSGSHASTRPTNNKESSSGQQCCERLPATFDTISNSAPSGNENLADTGPSVTCDKAKNMSYSYGEEEAPFDITRYARSKQTNRTTDCFSPSSSKRTDMCCDTVYNSSCGKIKPLASNEVQCIYSETSSDIIDVCNLLPQQEGLMGHMSGTQSSSRILNTVIIECTENIPLPSAGDLGANVVEFSMIRTDSETKEVYCAYKMVKSDSQYSSCIQDDHHFTNIFECDHCRAISTEQSKCKCCENCRTLSTGQSRYKCCETRVCNYNEENNIPSTSLWSPPANLTNNNCCTNSNFLQCEECSLPEVSPFPCKNIPPMPTDIERTEPSQMEEGTLKESPHIQEPTVFQENISSTDHCVSQQATVNHKIEAEMKPKKMQRSKSNRRKKGKNKRLCMSQQKGKAANKPRFNKQDVIASVVRLDVSDFKGDLELILP